MPRPRPGRFTRRLAVAFAVIGVGAATLTAVLVNTAFQARFTDYLADQQQARQDQLVTLFAADYRRNDGWNPRSLNQLAATVTMTGSEAEIRGADGGRVWSLSDADVDPAMLAMHRAMMGTGELGPSRELPIAVEGTRVGTLVVRVPQGAVPAVDQDFRDSVNQLLTVGSLVAGLVALTFGLVLARRVATPIAELTTAADDLAKGRRDRRVPVTSTDEIGRLSASFNSMADQVEKQDQLRRMFTADVAHELRTPLAILRSQLEAVQDGISKPTPQVITSLHDETVRLSRLVADLETLAAADAATFTLDRRPTSLTALLRELTGALADEFAEAGLALGTDLDEVTVDGDPVRLRQIATNLLTNARKFVPPGGTVTVTVRDHGDTACLEVSDTGPGIAPEELPRVFDRFYRSPTARAGGSGIGLAVVAELAAAHGGSADVDSEPGRGTTFRVRLPTTSPAADTRGGRTAVG
ncbi:sensor histidine kinase [Alloactinosynnema sp. L-07]|uniref:sensor histidine kinase n=1 Tax=Alloactinosynnema sp. L-07 TaxID=1653480 RepID=UPI00065EF37E|nr:ATP-binding protein [Alloactinosynnema sp. L-07]CRK55279.1 sensor histidine kinase [Alloactinosynnema sp. L-07]